MCKDGFNGLEIECFQYTLGIDKDPIFRVRLQSTIEGIVIENFGVTLCKCSSLQQTTRMSQTPDGYHYITMFRHEDGKCYTRTYTTAYAAFSAILRRSDAKQLITCPQELVKNVHLNRFKYIS